MDEGLWHARRRNQRWDEKQHEGAWQENRILEIYFAPVLDTPSYVSGRPSLAGRDPRRRPSAAAAQSTGPSDQVARARSGQAGTYTSDAQPYPIVLMPRWLWRICAVVAIAAIVRFRG